MNNLDSKLYKIVNRIEHAAFEGNNLNTTPHVQELKSLFLTETLDLIGQKQKYKNDALKSRNPLKYALRRKGINSRNQLRNELRTLAKEKLK